LGFLGTGAGFESGTGSSVGRSVAARLGHRFIDTDHEIVARAGKPIARIFAEDGEAAFRHLEREVIAALTQAPQPAVIATGGGALVVILHPQLEDTLRRVVESGGKITQEIFSYPGGRRFHFMEPSGNELSVCCEV